MAAFRVPAETILDVADALNADNLNALFSHVCALREMASTDHSGSIEREILEHLTSMRHAPADAILLGWAALSEDRVQVRRIHREVALHGNPLPAWLKEFPHAIIMRAFTVEYRDDDRISIMFEIVSDETVFVMSALIHFRAMGVMEDGYLLPGTIEALLEPLQRDSGDSITVTRVPELQAKASLEEAIAWADINSPLLDTETWPLLQPVFTTLLATLPDPEYEYDDDWRDRFLPGYLWNFEDAETVLHHFWQTVDPRGWLPGTRWLIERIAYLTADATCAALQAWPAGFIERLFTKDLLFGGLAELEDYVEFPKLFTRYVKFLEQSGHISEETAEDLRETSKRYADTLVTDAIQLHTLARDGELDSRTLFGRWRYVDAMLEEVTAHMGYMPDVDALDTEPFPIPKISTWGIRSTIAVSVKEAGIMVFVRGVALYSDPDMSAIMWRLVKYIASENPRCFERFSPETIGAAVAWIAGQNNGLVGRGKVTQQKIADLFGVSMSFMRCANSLREVLLPHERSWVFPLEVWQLLTAKQRQRLMIRYRELQRMKDDIETVLRDAQQRERRNPEDQWC